MNKDTDYEKVNETHQIENARQRKIKRRRKSYIFLLLLILCAFFYLCYQYLFKVVSVEYVGNEYYSNDTLSEAFGIKSGDRLFGYSKNEKEEKLLSEFPYLAECEIKRTVPDKITVTVRERKSIMYTYSLGRYIIFDKDMVVVELADKEPVGLMKVEFDEGILQRCVLGKEILFKDEKTGVGIYRVYEAVTASSLSDKIKSITVKSRFDYYLDYDGRHNVYLGDSTECKSKLLFLDGILQKLPEDANGNIDISNLKEGSYRENG
ncbi:MAG: FtsQ-type POTRA domain-containing protein [Ruminococcaceae bacterium]|nr:FtsQ-type POTRA domain-containing protein [Oscillospiraceae bacterium]